MAVAGESTSTSTEGDMARALESLMHQPPVTGDEERREPGMTKFDFHLQTFTLSTLLEYTVLRWCIA